MTIILFTGDYASSLQDINTPMGTGAEQSLGMGIVDVEHQNMLMTLTGATRAIQAVITKFTQNDPMAGVQAVKNLLKDPVAGVHPALLTISDSLQKTCQTILKLSGDPASAIQANSLSVMENNVVQSLQNVLTLIGSQTTQIQAISWDIYLDSVSIKGMIHSASITYSEDSVHNQFDLQSIDSDLFQKANPDVSQGSLRIEVHIGSRVLYFLLEERTGDEVSFRLWGRSGSARMDYPHSARIDVTMTGSASARSVVEDNLSAAIDWEIGNWYLPDTFEFEGYPIELAQKVAQIGGGIARCEDDGSIRIRRRFPVRPYDMDSSPADVDYDRMTDIIQIGYAQERGTGYDGVSVYGYTPEIVEPVIEVEDKEDGTSYEPGDDVHVKVYWGAYKPTDPAGGDPISTFLTDGSAIRLGEDAEEIIGGDEEDPNYVVFEEGTARASKPVHEIINQSWIGASGGTITYDEGYFDLNISGEDGYAIAQLAYITKYDRYKVTGHLVPILLKVIKQRARSEVSVSIVIDPDLNNPAPDIIDNNITTEAVARDRAESFLDTTRYDTQKVSLRVPYKADAIDGVLAYVNDANINVVGKYHISSVIINFDGPQIVSNVEVNKCLLSQS